ncbi:thimet oligopeptidase [Immersiella caudata]|uniref:Thimet oligopeptidase n=1 Tax=Immersiella caudata TaxID=314043 RepID=A0AA39WSQ9_9PEZI|nr:thimet oligopeptidase [Immersiella caudata]
MPSPPQPLPYIPKAHEIPFIIERLSAEYKASREAVVRDVTPDIATFDNVIRPLVETSHQVSGEIAVISCLGYAAPDKATRDAVHESMAKWSAMLGTVFSTAGLYQLVKAVSARDKPLDSESKLLVKNMVLDYETSGHGLLSKEKIDEYNKRRDEIDGLRRTFNENLRTDEDGLWLTEEELSGLKEGQIERLAKGTELPNIGKRFVPFRKSEYRTLMRNAENPAVRRAAYLANAQKLAQNVAVFDKVVQLRDINARMLGYKSHAAFRLSTRMAGTTKWVDQFLSSVRLGLGSLAKRDLERLHAKKQTHVASHSSEHFFPWDFFYHTRLCEEDINVQEDRISEYFPLEHTVKTMLKLFTDRLGLVFVPIPKEELIDHVWHEDVDVFGVWDGDALDQSPFVGFLYTDLLWREGKYRGNQNVNLQLGFEKPDGTRMYPATTLMCAFTRSSTAGCALLKHSEVVTMFHELGHGIHDLVSRTKYSRFHSYNGTRDFGEAPSMFLENFCWVKDELREMSCHYSKLGPEYLAQWRQANPDAPDPPEKIPDEMVDSLVASRSLNQGWWTGDQLAVALFDMAVHNPESHEHLLQLDTAKLYNDLLEETAGLVNPDPTSRGHPHVHFGHLLHGYDAGYYSYLWGFVFGADMFETAFAPDTKTREVWERYRRTILEPGGSQDELNLVERFLGRPVSPEALFRRLRAAAK